MNGDCRRLLRSMKLSYALICVLRRLLGIITNYTFHKSYLRETCAYAAGERSVRTQFETAHALARFGVASVEVVCAQNTVLT